MTVGQMGRWLLLLPFLFFATISQGTMLAAGEDGMRVVLCTGEGTIEAMILADGEVVPVDDHDRSGDHSTGMGCDWALHGQAGLAGLEANVLPPLILELDAVHAIDQPAHLRRAEVLTPAARGPPTLI